MPPAAGPVEAEKKVTEDKDKDVKKGAEKLKEDEKKKEVAEQDLVNIFPMFYLITGTKNL